MLLTQSTAFAGVQC